MQKLDPQKKQSIITAAKSRFHRYGIQKTTMQEIARDAGLSVGTLYLYFKNKDEILLACTQVFREEHDRAARLILKSDRAADEKLRQYILNRFRAARATREGSDRAAEIARAVMRLDPYRIEAEASLTMRTIGEILQQGCETGLFHHVNLEADIEVFAYSIAYFFPIAGKEPHPPPEEEKLLAIVNWFIAQWQRP
ncbi:TetR/AcrR family transcriptional regulator [Chroococcidiopsidales cyanobacterium LEGE 13417]|nr:TetR/AcrR family transcriptional regulator [Chroococcidiopsidales cyanobacterium LEGE 13417]